MAMWGVGLMVAPISGADAGRMDHRQLELALEFLRINSADWRGRAADGLYLLCTIPVYCASAAPRAAASITIGIICLVLGLGLMEIVLDRGQRADWFNAPGYVTLTAAWPRHSSS